jgi:hypothetical protein
VGQVRFQDLRHILTGAVAHAKVGEGYQYLTGPRFRQRVEAIVEGFSSMQDDLYKERKAITKQWAKRQGKLTVCWRLRLGMHGDLSGIAGKSIQEIEWLELKALSAGEEG